MSEKLDSPAPTLQSDWVELRQLDESVLGQYLVMLGDPEGQRLTATTQKFTRERVLDWLQTRPVAAGRLDWAILNRETEEFLGEVVLNEFDQQRNTMNLRICLREQQVYSLGIGSAAIDMVMRHAFDSLRLSKLRLEVLVDNSRAIRVYEKLGFQRGREFSEGKHRFLRMSADRYDLVRRIAETAIERHLPNLGWTFAFDNARRRAGLCSYSERRISLSRYLVDIHPLDDSEQVILHEIAHAMLGKREGHSKNWLKTAKQIGYRAEKFTGAQIAQSAAPWVGYCPGGHEHFRYRRPSQPMSCGKCARGYSPSFEIRWAYREG